jgi:branched-chain amino acid transport system substrate-binding protein
VVGYTDYPPGKDSLDAFKRGFESGGRLGGGRDPDGRARAGAGLHAVLPARQGQEARRVLRLRARGRPCGERDEDLCALGMREAGIKLVGPGDITQDIKLQSMGKDAVGLITAHHYNADLDNAANRRLVAAWREEYGADSTPDFMAVQGYDGMAAIAHVVRTLGGRIDAEGAMKALKGWKYDSPRGPISIDPATRDIVMNGPALTSHRRAKSAAAGPFSPAAREREVRSRHFPFLSHEVGEKGPIRCLLASDGK